MASPTPSKAPDSPTGQPNPLKNGISSGSAGVGRHGLPIQLNITGNGSAAIYYFDRPGTYNVLLGPNGIPSSGGYTQPNRENATSETRSISSQPNSSKIPVLKR